MTPILPGATLGVLGSGQLGRLFALAARAMGYRIHVFAPDAPDSPAGQVADRAVAAPYDDLDAVRDFAKNVDVVTFEFENVSATATAAAAEYAPVRPAGRVLHVAQNRRREKTFLSDHGFPVAPFAPSHPADLDAALARVGLPAVLKTAGFGYDGKGQIKVDSGAEARAALATFAGREAVVEAWVSFAAEVSVVAARASDGAFAHFGVVQNEHANHILDVTTVPATLEPSLADEAIALTRAVLDQLDVVGVLCIEFFVTTSGKLLVNELAPRPHNSGHWTIEGCVTSQFEQQVRTVCGLPLGSTTRVRPAAAMANLLGDLWERGTPDWAAMLAGFPDVKLHLYGKADARPGRKMGHLTALAGSPNEAALMVRAARSAAAPPP